MHIYSLKPQKSLILILWLSWIFQGHNTTSCPTSPGSRIIPAPSEGPLVQGNLAWRSHPPAGNSENTERDGEAMSLSEFHWIPIISPTFTSECLGGRPCYSGGGRDTMFQRCLWISMKIRDQFIFNSRWVSNWNSKNPSFTFLHNTFPNKTLWVLEVRRIGNSPSPHVQWKLCG